MQTVAESTRSIWLFYQALFGYQNVDTEFAVDFAGSVLLLQCRPVVENQASDIQTVDTKKLQADSVVCTGSYSLLGAVVGRARVVTKFEDLASGATSLEPDDIIFAAKTANYWNQYLSNLKASCHSAHVVCMPVRKHALCGRCGRCVRPL